MLLFRGVQPQHTRDCQEVHEAGAMHMLMPGFDVVASSHDRGRGWWSVSGGPEVEFVESFRVSL